MEHDSWYNWHKNAKDAVRYAHNQCQRWGTPFWWVWKVQNKGYLTGTANTYYGAKLVCRVSVLGKIQNLIGKKT